MSDHCYETYCSDSSAPSEPDHSSTSASTTSPPAANDVHAPGAGAGNPLLTTVPPAGAHATLTAPQPASADPEAAARALPIIADMIIGKWTGSLDGVEPRFMTPMMKLNLAFNGNVPETEKLQVLDAAMAELQPLLHAYDTGSWLDGAILGPVDEKRKQLQASSAREKVKRQLDGAQAGDQPLTFETSADEKSEEERAQLLEVTGQLIDTAETVTSVREGALAAKGMEYAHGEGGSFDGAAMGKVEGALSVLKVVHGVLELSDGEALKGVREARFGSWSAAMKGVGSYAELITQVTELVESESEVVIGVAKVACKIAGNAELVEKLAKVGDKLKVLGVAVDVLGVVKDASIVADPNAKTEDRIDAGVDGAATVAGYVPGVGTAAKYALKAGWAMVKAMAGAYGELAGDFLSGVDEGLKTLAESGSTLAFELERLADAGVMLEHQTDPSMRAALEEQMGTLLSSVAERVDSMLDQCKPAGLQAGEQHPGSVATIAEAFAPLQRFQGPTDATAVVAAATAVLQATRSCLDDAPRLRAAEQGVYVAAGASGL